jgi:hypothetical protein
MKITEQIYALKHSFQIPVAPGKILDRFVYSYVSTYKKFTLANM